METILPRHLEEEMKAAYLDYSMSVIVGRALPDARDGLKPVHRRVLYSMHELGLAHNKQHRKSARIVGDTMGKYHPHGDAAVYDTMVRMAQDFALRYPLVDGQGNWGCFTADTKVRLADGRSLSFAELVEEDKQGKRNYTFTIRDDGFICLALVRAPRITRLNAELVAVQLDNGSVIKCTPGHRFMLRDGTYQEARQLRKGDSLMPLYTRLADQEDNLRPAVTGYELVRQPNMASWQPVHHLADAYNLETGVYRRSDGRVRHHRDFNKLNNNPDNIIRMGWQEHRALHASLSKQRHACDEEYVRKLVEGRARYWADPVNKAFQAQKLVRWNMTCWKDPVWAAVMRVKVREAHERRMSNPQVRAQVAETARETMKRLWRTTRYRELFRRSIAKANKARETNNTGKKKFVRTVAIYKAC